MHIERVGTVQPFARRLASIAMALTACASGPEDCQPAQEQTCLLEGGTCGDGTGPGCEPGASHIDYTKSCIPKIGPSGTLGAVCCLPGPAVVAEKDAAVEASADADTQVPPDGGTDAGED
jgi:hypothetical protein